jgi:DNA gyrase subunit A
MVKICAPDWPVRAEEFDVLILKDDDEVVGASG